MSDKKTDTVVKVSGVKKDFILPHEKNSRSIKSKIVHSFKKKDKGYDIQHALRGVSFEVKKGEFFGIVGRNGSGKSTLLKMIAGIYQPTAGKITTKGKLVPFIELGVGFNPELTGRENVYLNGSLLGFSRKQVDDMYDDIVDFAELGDFMEQKLKNYSSGMQVRLAFSVAIKAQGDVLVLDEVLAVGDADFQRKCYNYFKFLKKNSKTVILVTHDMNAVKEYCDRAILINDGKIKNEGTPADVSESYLKLFNTSYQSSKDDDSKSKRWGNGIASLEQYDISVDKTIKLEFVIKASETVDNVVFGYRIYDESGKVIAGVNNATAKGGGVDTLAFKKGETKKLTFIGDNILGTGSYTLGYTIRLTDMVTICDDNMSVYKFNYTLRDSHQPIVLPVNLEIKEMTRPR